MELEEQVAAAYQGWYEGLEKDKSNGLPDWGPLCTGLVILERLLANYTLDIDDHRTSNGAQIRGQGLPLANKILEKFHAPMKLTSGEFGRTNRSSVPTAEKLLHVLMPLHLEDLTKDERNRILTALQEKLLTSLLMYSDHFQIEAHYEPTMNTEKFIRSVLSKGTPKTSGAIAQHLVGAKLELRFPDIDISNHSASTADAPTERSGDFIVGDTVFHVTMAPQDLVFLKCKSNLAADYRVYLLVPEVQLQLAFKKAKAFGLEEHIVVKSIESFIGQNIDELGMFSTHLLRQELNKLIDVYNRRILVERYAPELRIEEEISRGEEA
jgi:hypothetical protein